MTQQLLVKENFLCILGQLILTNPGCSKWISSLRMQRLPPQTISRIQGAVSLFTRNYRETHLKRFHEHRITLYLTKWSEKTNLMLKTKTASMATLQLLDLLRHWELVKLPITNPHHRYKNSVWKVNGVLRAFGWKLYQFIDKYQQAHKHKLLQLQWIPL